MVYALAWLPGGLQFKSRALKIIFQQEERNELRELRGCVPIHETSLYSRNQRQFLTVSQQREVNLKGREWHILIHVGL